MSTFGLIEEDMELSHFHLAVQLEIFNDPNLSVLFMVRKKFTTKKIQLRFLTMKSTGKFDWLKISNRKKYR